jgi:hypothetical protein
MNNFRMTRGTLTTFALAALLCAPLAQKVAFAQGPPPGGFGGGPGGGFGGGGGGFNRRPPFAIGTVSAVDSGAGTITITSQFGGATQTIQTQGMTQIVSQSTAAVADLQKGDKIQVQGVPTGITASALTIGQSPFAGLGGPGGPPPGQGAPPPAGGPGAPPAAGPASATATGTVTSLSPLTISLSDTTSLVLKLAANAKVTKYTTVTLSAVKVGDKVVSLGQANDDGTFAATTVALNVDMASIPGMGQRGMGRRGGFGGGGGGGFGGNARGGFGGGPQGPPPPQ